MKTSESIAKIAAALVKAQAAIEYASKTAANPHLKNKYADLGDVIQAVKPALVANGIAYLQLPCEAPLGEIRLTTRLIHESGEWIEETMSIPCTKADPQGAGSAITYARRYALAAVTGLYQDDDDGQAAMHRSKAAARAEQALGTPAGQGKQPAVEGEQPAAEEPMTAEQYWASFTAMPDIVAAFNALSPEDREAHKALFDARRKELMAKGTPRGAAATRAAIAGQQ